MNFERKVIETLKDDNGNGIVSGDCVIYTIKNNIIDIRKAKLISIKKLLSEWVDGQ